MNKQRQTNFFIYIYIKRLYFANDAIMLRKSGIINEADTFKYQLLLVTSFASRLRLF